MPPLHVHKDATGHHIGIDLDYGKVHWGKAKTNWVSDLPNCDYVPINPVADCNGNQLNTSVTRNILLPIFLARDPNVCQSDIIGYLETTDNLYVAVTDYLDDQIDTVKMWCGDYDDIPCGWEWVADSEGRAVWGAANDGENCTTANCTPTGAVGTVSGSDSYAYASGSCPKPDRFIIYLIKRIDNSATP